jgi:hypothetical protein
MATHSDLVIEQDMTLSSRIGRVLFINFNENPGLVLKQEDVILHKGEKLAINSIEDVRALGPDGNCLPIRGIRVKSV